MGISLEINESDDILIKYIKTKEPHEKIVPQQITDNKIVGIKANNFIPSIDIIADEQYQLLIDVPGFSKDNIIIYRQNTNIFVKGQKQKPYKDDKTLERNERRYGDFTLVIKIPEIYQRKWTSCEIDKGVVKIVFDKDQEESNCI